SDGARHFRGGAQQVFDHRVDGDFHLAPRAARLLESHAFARAALLADHLADAIEFASHLLIGGDDVVERIGDLASEAGPSAGQAGGEITVAERSEAGLDYAELGRGLRIGAG